MSVFPLSIEIQHQIFTATGTDGHGNPTGALSDPIPRQIIGIQQLGDGRVDPISVDFDQRTVTDLILQVPDPTLYKKLDNVLVFNGDEWLAYEVQGKPVNWSLNMPWQRYSKIFGGTVHVRRVE